MAQREEKRSPEEPVDGLFFGKKNVSIGLNEVPNLWPDLGEGQIKKPFLDEPGTAF
jgi:hypothetical protein